MAKQWVNTRLQESTVRRLNKMREAILTVDVTSDGYIPGDAGLWLSVDALVNLLLDARDGHKERRRRSAQRRRAGRRPASTPIDVIASATGKEGTKPECERGA